MTSLDTSAVHYPYGHAHSCGRTFGSPTSTDPAAITCASCATNARAALIAEIRRDSNERAARVDGLIAESHAAREVSHAERTAAHFPFGHPCSCGRTIGHPTSIDAQDVTCDVCLSEYNSPNAGWQS